MTTAGTGRGALPDRGGEQVDAGLVERGERLVEQQQRRLVLGRARDREALQHAARQRARRTLAGVGRGRPARGSRARCAVVGCAVDRRVAAVQPREELEVLLRREVLVDHRLVTEEADACQDVARRPAGVAVGAEQRSRPALAREMQASSRSSVLLPAPFGPSTATISPRVDVEVDVAQHQAHAERLAQARGPRSRCARPGRASPPSLAHGRANFQPRRRRAERRGASGRATVWRRGGKTGAGSRVKTRVRGRPVVGGRAVHVLSRLRRGSVVALVLATRRAVPGRRRRRRDAPRCRSRRRRRFGRDPHGQRQRRGPVRAERERALAARVDGQDDDRAARHGAGARRRDLARRHGARRRRGRARWAARRSTSPRASSSRCATCCVRS